MQRRGQKKSEALSHACACRVRVARQTHNPRGPQEIPVGEAIVLRLFPHCPTLDRPADNRGWRKLLCLNSGQSTKHDMHQKAHPS